MEGLGPTDTHLEFRGLSAGRNVYIVVLGLEELPNCNPLRRTESTSQGFHDLAAEPKNRSRTRVVRQDHDLAVRPQSRLAQDLGTQPGISRPSHPRQPRFRMRTNSKPGDESKGSRPGVGVKAPGTLPSHALEPEPRFSVLAKLSAPEPGFSSVATI